MSVCRTIHYSRLPRTQRRGGGSHINLFLCPMIELMQQLAHRTFAALRRTPLPRFQARARAAPLPDRRPTPSWASSMTAFTTRRRRPGKFARLTTDSRQQGASKFDREDANACMISLPTWLGLHGLTCQNSEQKVVEMPYCWRQRREQSKAVRRTAKGVRPPCSAVAERQARAFRCQKARH